MSGREVYGERRGRWSTQHPRDVYNHPVATLRAKIKALEGEKELFEGMNDHDAEVMKEQILLNKQVRSIRRVYLVDNKYKVGWVIDTDLEKCMICIKTFGWIKGRLKHHCRACGALVCHECSPYSSPIPFLEEAVSRVCKNCFGLKPGIFSPLDRMPDFDVPYESSYRFTMQADHDAKPQEKTASRQSLSALDVKPMTSRPKAQYSPLSDSGVRTRSVDAVWGSGKVRRYNLRNGVETEETRLARYIAEMEALEKEMLPRYEEAYRTMRELIPLDIYKSNVVALRKLGLPDNAATRIWNTKILWLIVMHKDDIKKIHLADFRSKYIYDGLDIIEMRAVWYALPNWRAESDNPLERGKAEWKEGLKSKLDDYNYKEAHGTISAHLRRHPAYEECEYLQLFDSTIETQPRFHRSASFKQAAIASPMVNGEEDVDSSLMDMDNSFEPLNIQQRSHRYLQNFISPDDDKGHRQESAYRTLLDEIAAEDVLGDQDHSNLDDLVEQDDISSLGMDFPTVASDGGVPTAGLKGSMSVNSNDRTTTSTRASAVQSLTPKGRRGVGEVSPSPSAFVTRSTPNSPMRFGNHPSPRASEHILSSSLSEKGSHLHGHIKRGERSKDDSSMSVRSLSPIPSLSRSYKPFQTPHSVSSNASPLIAAPQLVYSAASSSVGSSLPCDRTPQTFVSVNSAQSYKFLSTSKKPIPLLSDLSPISTPFSPSNEEPLLQTPLMSQAEDFTDSSIKSVVSDKSRSMDVAAPASLSGSTDKKRSGPDRQSSDSVGDSTTSSVALLTQDGVKQALFHGELEKLLAYPEGVKASVENVFSPPEVLSLAWSLFRELAAASPQKDRSMRETLQDSLLLLIDEEVVSVNLLDMHQRSLLWHAVDQNLAPVGRELISRGADILSSDRSGSSPLSLALKKDVEWLLEELEETDLKNMVTQGGKSRALDFFAHFVLAGYSEEAKEIMNSGLLKVSVEEATELLRKCQGNFESMRDPVETFELLESLGAVL